MHSEPESPARPAMRLRFSLMSMLLLITLVAVVMAWQQTRSQWGSVRNKVESMRPLVRELDVKNPARIAMIDRLPTLPDERITDIYLPGPVDLNRSTNPADNQTQYRLCLALEQIVGSIDAQAAFPKPEQTVMISPGRHSVELRHRSPDSGSANGHHRIEVWLDGKPVIKAQRPASWISTKGWTGSASYRETHVFDTREPAEIHRRRFNQPTPTGSRSRPESEPAQGILIWIEPESR